MSAFGKAELCRRVLETLGVLASGETPSAADESLVGEAIAAAYSRLRKFGLAPFESSDIPEWAQIQLRDIVAGDVAQAYGMSGQRLIEFKQVAEAGEFELARQMAGFKPPVPIEVEFF